MSLLTVLLLAAVVTYVLRVSLVTVVPASQNVSQLSFVVAPSSETRRSKRIPAGVTPNHFAF